MSDRDYLKPLADLFPALDISLLAPALGLIDAPPDLMGLQHASKCAPTILAITRKFADLYREEDQHRTAQFAEYVDRCLEQVETLSLCLAQAGQDVRQAIISHYPNIYFSPSDIDRTGRGRKSLRPHMDTHPLFCAIWCGCNSAKVKNQHELLIAFALLTLLRMDDFERRSKRADLGRCLRKLGEFDSAPLLDGLPDTPCTIDAFFYYLTGGSTDYSQFACSLEEPLEFYTRRALEAWGRFQPGLRRGQHATSDKGGGTTVGSPYNSASIVETRASDAICLANGIAGYEIVQSGNSALAGDPDHDFPSPVVVLEITPANPLDNQSRQDVIRTRLRSRGMHAALASQRQHLPFSLAQPTPTEIHELLNSLQQLQTNSLEEEEAKLLLWLSLLSGRPTAELAHVQLDISSKPETHHCFYITHSDKRWLLHVPVPAMQRKDLVQPENQGCYHPLEEYLALPLPDWLAVILQGILPNTRQRKKSAPLLPRRKKSHEYLLLTLLEQINTSTSYRWNLNRLQSVLFDRLLQMQGGDPTIACMITGQQREQYRNPLTYTALTADSLISSYRQALSGILSSEGGVSGLAYRMDSGNLMLDETLPENTPVLGSRLRPVLSSLKLCIHDLNDVIEPGLKSQTLQNLHNAYTLYTLLMLAFSTGSRPTQEAFYLETDLDLDSGWCVISDKDRDDYLHARPIYLASIVRDHMRHYRTYRKRLLPRLLMTNPQHPAATKNQHPTISHHASRSEVADVKARITPYLFFLHRDLSVQMITQQSYMNRLEAYLPLRPNSNRHLLRSLLRQEGCGQNLLAAFMGHHRHGEEPWGKYSSLNPRRFAQVMDLHIARLLELLSMQPIPCPIS